VFLSGLFFYGVLWLCDLCWPSFFSAHYFLLGIALAKTLLFYSLPYKQLAAGREQFGVLMRMSVASNLVKAAAVVACFIFAVWSVPVMLVIFIVGDLTEWILSGYIGRKFLGAPAGETLWAKIVRAKKGGRGAREAVTLRDWQALIRESLPQAGVVLFSSAMARFDWIFIGLFISASKLAEYSFAYKAFEVSSVPLLVIAPLLVPFFTRTLRNGVPDERRSRDLQQLLKGELILGWGVALCLNIVWNPLVDRFTGGMYGRVNTGTIFILSLCLPLQYLNNFLWTIHFAKGRLNLIFRTFLVGFVVNVAGDLLLIPAFGNEGAAVAYLAAILLQTLLYHPGIREVSLGRAWVTFCFCGIGAAAAGWAAVRVGSGVLIQWTGASVFFCVFLILTAQLRLRDIGFLRSKLS
jgi:O-antigen/teichoic acid export membrane protein